MVCALFKFSGACPNLPIEKVLIEYLLVPSVISILMVYMITEYMMRDTNIGIKSLVSITVYIVFVYSGIYGIFAPLFYAYVYFMVLIVGGLFLFTRVISRQGWYDLGSAARTYKESKTDLKQLKRAIEIREKEKGHFEDMIDKLRKSPGYSLEDESVLNMLMHQVSAEIDNLRSLEGQVERAGLEAASDKTGKRAQEIKILTKSGRDYDQNAARLFQRIQEYITSVQQTKNRVKELDALNKTQERDLRRGNLS